MNQEKIVELLKEIQKIKTFEQIKKTNDYGLLVDILQSIIGKINLAKGEQGIRGEKGDKGDKGEQGIRGIQGVQGKSGKDGRNGKDGRDGLDGLDGEDADEKKITQDVIAEIKKELPKLGEQIKEALSRDELEIKDIKDLEKTLKDLEKKISNGYVYFGGGGGTGKHNVVAYDLSGQLNGSSRVFNTPAMWRPVAVLLSSFPNVLRPTIDYTWTPSTLTLTSEVPDSSLITGQTLILIYSEG